MDYDTTNRITVILSVIAIVASVAAIGLTLTSDNGENDTKYTLYLGLGDASGNQIDSIENELIVMLTEEYGIGYTMYRATGGSVVGGDVITDDVTLVLILMFVDEGTVNDIAEAAKEKFDINTVLIEKQKVNASLV